MPLDRLQKQSGSDNIHGHSADDQHASLRAINTEQEPHELRQEDRAESGDSGADAKSFVPSLSEVSVHCKGEGG